MMLKNSAISGLLTLIFCLIFMLILMPAVSIMARAGATPTGACRMPLPWRSMATRFW